MKKYLLLSCLFFTYSFNLQAAPTSLLYADFYKRIEKVNKGNFQLIELVFTVPNKQQCRLIDSYISSDKDHVPLIHTDEQRIFIPFDQQLKNDRAQIHLNIEGDNAQCGIGMQIRAKKVKTRYEQADLQLLVTQMDGLLKSLQGFPLKYFTHDISGLHFEFDDTAMITIDGKTQLVTGAFELSATDIAKLKQLDLSVKPQVISPWINKS